MNKCIFYGMVASELRPSKKITQDGRELTSLFFSLSVKNGKRYSYIPCVAYNKTADLIMSYVKKNDKLIVEGALKLFDKTKDTEVVQGFNIQVYNIFFIDKRLGGLNVVDEDDKYIMLEKNNSNRDIGESEEDIRNKINSKGNDEFEQFYIDEIPF